MVTDEHNSHIEKFEAAKAIIAEWFDNYVIVVSKNRPDDFFTYDFSDPSSAKGLATDAIEDMDNTDVWFQQDEDSWIDGDD